MELKDLTPGIDISHLEIIGYGRLEFPNIDFNKKLLYLV